jgi:hypothetical protein
MHQEERPLVGWSPVADSPEILETIRKSKKSSLGWALALTLLFPVGFLIAGVVSDEVPLKEALIIGCGLGLCILTINLWRFAGMKRRGWDGAVVKKMEKKRYKRDDDGSSQLYTEYIVLIRTDGGKKKKIVERKRDREMYDYLDIGDRVRYHPALETYEKYDKSKDEAIYCNVCRQRNPISNDRCELCNNLLFK